MKSKQISSTLAVLSVLMLIMSSIAVGVAQDRVESTEDEVTQDFGQADEVFVDENGDVVLVYKQDSPDDTKIEYGADLSKGLIHFMANSTSMDTGSNFSGSMMMVMDPETIKTEGDFDVLRPDEVQNLLFDASGEVSDQNSQMSASLEGTFAQQGQEPGMGAAMLFNSLETSGQISAGPNQFSTSGDFSVELGSMGGAGQQSQQVNEQSFVFRETGNKYVLEAQQRYQVSDFQSDSWNTREKAKRTLERQMGLVAQQLGGSVKVSVDSHSFDSNNNLLDVSYTVEFTGIDDQLSQRIARILSSNSQLDLSQQEARSVGESVKKIKIDRIEVSFSQQGGSTEASWDVQISNYNDALLSFFDLAESMRMGMGMQGPQQQFMDQLNRTRKTIEAQSASNLKTTFDWSVNVQSQEETLDVSAEVGYDTNNWGSYVDELEKRGISPPGDFSFEAHAESSGDSITGNFNARVSQSDLVSSAIDSLSDTTTDLGVSRDGQAQRMMRMIKDADFEKARMDMSLEGNKVDMRAGVRFKNASALRSLIASQAPFADIQSITGGTENGQTVTYVRVGGLVAEDVTESQVRQLDFVGPDTTVHMPGDWEESDIPSVDSDSVNNYLQSASTEGEGGGMFGLPVFEPIGVVVLVAVLFVIFRRRTEEE